MNIFALSFVFMLALVLAELAIMKFVQGRALPWREVIFNLNSGHILMWVGRGIEVALFALVLKYASVHIVDQWPLALQWVFGFIGWDFTFYWMHRMHHKMPFFWAVHVVHHQGEEFNLSLGIRNSWYSSLTSFLFVAILAVLGLPVEIFLVVSSIHYSVQFYNHNGIVKSSGFLDKIMVTPAYHRVHHASAPIYLDKNFGGTLQVWDKLFGTFQAREADTPLVFGVPGMERSDNPLWANNAGLFRFVRARFPGLRALPGFAVPDLFIGSGGVILFGLVIYYVNHELDFGAAHKLALFTLIFAATIALGALSDGRRWGAIGWVVLALGMPLLVGGLYGVRDAWGWCFLGLLLLHGLDGLRRLIIPGGRAAG
ncbi:MAG: sterol desaturase family protein [Pseudomonadota bacterium]